MMVKGRGDWFAVLWVAVATCALAAGCQSCPGTCCACKGKPGQPNCGPMARELEKVSMPPYVVEPPDVLLVDAIRVVPRPPYHVEPLDGLLVQVANAKPNEPIGGVYLVDPDGTVNLGFSYGAVRVAGMTVEQATKAIDDHLKKILRTPQVSVALAASRAMQQIRGEHLVRQDGTIGLGTYGSVYVAGLTLPDVQAAIQEHLSEYLLNPEVSVDVSAYNSKVYYVITDGGGFGRQVYRLPILGNETVLDALGQVNGVPAVSARNCIWIARPAPVEAGGKQILPVDLVAITEEGQTATNYQLLPGDRIFVKADGLIRLDNALTKVLTPVNRVFGSMLLGSFAVDAVQGRLNGFGGFGGIPR